MSPQAPQPTPPGVRSSWSVKKRITLVVGAVVVVLVGLVAAGFAIFFQKDEPLDSDKVAKEYVDAMVHKDYEKAYSMLNDGPNEYIGLKKKIDLATYTKNLEPAPFSPEKCAYTITNRETHPQQSSGGHSVDVVEGTLACDETFTIYLEIITTGQYAGIRAYKIDPAKSE